MKKPDLSQLNIEHDLFDQGKFDQLVDSAQIIKDTLKEGKSQYDLFPPLLQDSFNSFYKYVPELADPTTVQAQCHFNRTLIENSMATLEYQQLRAFTRSDMLKAATAAATMTETILKDNEDTIKQIQAYLKQIKETKADNAKLTKEIKALQKNAQQPLTSQQQSQVQQQIQILQQKQTQVQQQQQATQQAVGQIGGTINCSNAVQSALNAVQFQDDCLSGAGWGTEAGWLNPVSMEDRLALSQALIKQPKLLKIMQVAGRFRTLAIKKQRQKTKHAVDEISDIHQSDDLGHLLPTEAMLLADPDLEFLFWAKFVERKLFTYELSGMETKGRGPIIVCLDISGSMGGDKDCWAKGVALALVEIAHREKRNAIVIVFDTEVHQVFEFMKNTFNWQTVVELAGYFTGGGTDFDAPLLCALDYLDREKELKNGDIILVTDGQSDVSELVRVTFLEKKALLKFSMFTIIIGAEFEWVDHVLKPLSDQFHAVEDLTQDLAAEVFENV